MRWTSPTLRRAVPRVLRGVSFTVRPGEVLGLLGRTGSGKTTITRLLLRLYDPTAGHVRLGGVELRRLRRWTICAGEVAMVTQDVQLFRATVRDNLTLFDRERPGGQRAGGPWTRLGLVPWLRASPAGTGHPAGTGRRGPLRRARLSCWPADASSCATRGVVILDEASSRLDPATERFICRGHRPAAGGAHGNRRRPPPGDGTAGGRRPRPGGGPGGRVGPARRPGRRPPVALRRPACGALRQGRRCWRDRRDRRDAAATDTAGVVVRLIAYSPWRFGLAVASSDPGLRSPGGTGLIVKRFFDTLSGSAPAGPANLDA